eukprot:scaffold10215_cov32-Tisochrysis_lutea.AAC.3
MDAERRPGAGARAAAGTGAAAPLSVGAPLPMAFAICTMGERPRSRFGTSRSTVLALPTGTCSFTRVQVGRLDTDRAPAPAPHCRSAPAFVAFAEASFAWPDWRT